MNCRDCGEPVSAAARFCLNCGRKLDEVPAVKRGLGHAIGIMALIFLVIGLIGVLMTNSKSTQTPTPAEAAQKQRDDNNVLLAVDGAKRLQRAMRNPDSFKLSQVLMMNNDAICYEYRAQNGFGGMNVGRAVLAPDGQFEATGTPKFRALWNKECAEKSGIDKASLVSSLANIHQSPSDK